MSWDTTLTTIARNMIGDLIEPYTYSDDRLAEIICVAGAYVDQAISLTNDYVFDFSEVSISPDPITIGDKIAQSLFILKAIHLIAMGEYRVASNSAISMRDGPSSIDARGVVAAKKVFMDDALKAYEEAEFSFAFGDGSVGQAIVGPYNGGI